jgi:hypothetical protein
MRAGHEAAARSAQAHHRRMRHAFGIVEAAPKDDSGAFRIPDALHHLGRIDSAALFIGTGDRFEIWNPDLAAASGDSVLRDLTLVRMSALRRRPPRKARRARRAVGTRPSARRREGQ